jgi:hypothetical protein
MSLLVLRNSITALFRHIARLWREASGRRIDEKKRVFVALFLVSN